MYSLFGGSSNETTDSKLSKNSYRTKVFKEMDIATFTENNEIINLADNKEELIDFKKILEIIKTQDEEFIFFAHWASSKILNYSNKTEFYFSLIFLNEIFVDVNEKKFAKIWPNLLNITKDKMDSKSVFENNINVFDFLFMNYILNEIMSKYSNCIESDEYVQLLEVYMDIENQDLIYNILENNNRLIKSFSKTSQLKK